MKENRKSALECMFSPEERKRVENIKDWEKQHEEEQAMDHMLEGY